MYILKRLRSVLRALWRPTAESGAQAVLRWLLLCAAVAVVCAVLGALGCYSLLDDWQLILLGGDTFQLSALDAQVSLLSPACTCVLSGLLTLYLGAVLLHQPRLSKRNHVCLLAAAALALPGCICVLWHGVLYVSLPLTCVCVLWLLVVPLALIRRFFS